MAEILDIDATLDLPGFQLAARAEIPLQGITALTGPSGSGKTTLLRLISGLEPGAQGRMRFAGDDWITGTHQRPAHRRRVGMVFQETRLFRHLSVAGNIAYGARRAGVEQGRIDELTEALELTPLLNRPVGDLSGGEAHRVALARALARDPQLLLLDEPLAGLDAKRRARAMAMIVRVVHQSAVPAIYVSHSAEEVAALADRVLGIEGGRVTGWQPPPVMLRGRLERIGPKAYLTCGDTRIGVDDQHTAEGPVVISMLDADVFLATQNPGRATCALTLEAGVVHRPERGCVTLETAGQRLSLTLTRYGEEVLADSGAHVWLCATKIWVRTIGLDVNGNFPPRVVKFCQK